MTQRILHLTIILVAASFSSYSQTWIRFTPAQANAIGKKFISYDKKTKYASISGELNPDVIVLSDHPSEDVHKEDFKRSLTISLKGFLGKKAVIGNVDASGLVVTQIDTLRFCKPGRFVFSGIKANSIKIKLKRETTNNIKPKDLLNEIQKYTATIDPGLIAALNVIDSVSWEKNNSMEIEIKNPTVYYMIQIAELKENLGTPDKYFINHVRLEEENLVLNSNYPVTSKQVHTVISRSLRNGIEGIVIELLYKKLTPKSKPELYVRYTKQGGGGTKEKIVPMLSDTRWDENKFLVHDYVLDEKRSKPIYLNIKAELVGDDIKVTRAIYTYPEKEIKIIKF